MSSNNWLSTLVTPGEEKEESNPTPAEQKLDEATDEASEAAEKAGSAVKHVAGAALEKTKKAAANFRDNETPVADDSLFDSCLNKITKTVFPSANTDSLAKMCFNYYRLVMPTVRMQERLRALEGKGDDDDDKKKDKKKDKKDKKKDKKGKKDKKDKKKGKKDKKKDKKGKKDKKKDKKKDDDEENEEGGFLDSLLAKRELTEEEDEENSYLFAWSTKGDKDDDDDKKEKQEKKKAKKDKEDKKGKGKEKDKKKDKKDKKDKDKKKDKKKKKPDYIGYMHDLLEKPSISKFAPCMQLLDLCGEDDTVCNHLRKAAEAQFKHDSCMYNWMEQVLDCTKEGNKIKKCVSKYDSVARECYRFSEEANRQLDAADELS